MPADTVVIDTSNYFPHRDNGIASSEAGQAETVWAAKQMGRSIAKAWNSIGSESFAHRDKPAGSADRISLPVAADGPRERDLAMALVEDTGFDAFDAGPLAESWRQQPGTPAGRLLQLLNGRIALPQGLALHDAPGVLEAA